VLYEHKYRMREDQLTGSSYIFDSLFYNGTKQCTLDRNSDRASEPKNGRRTFGFHMYKSYFDIDRHCCIHLLIYHIKQKFVKG